MSTAEHPAQVLGQGVGWAVVVGLGLAFAAFMISLTWIQSRYTEHKATSVEEFSSASRSVRPGLIAAGIVSAWTWAATLLTSASMTYQYGVAGAYWYSAGAMLQILLCSIMACKLKSFAPFCSHLPGDRSHSVRQARACCFHGLCVCHQLARIVPARIGRRSCGA